MDFLSLNIDPVAFWIGSFPVRWYALAYLAGFLLGWKYCLLLVRSDAVHRPNEEDIDNFISWAVIGVILGGRIGYVLFYNAGYYFQNPLEIIMVMNGGMSFHGGVLGMVCALWGYSYKHKVNLFKLSDIICMAAPIGLFFGRLANFINAELYGRVTSVPWGVVFPGHNEPRHPSQIYEAFLEGIVLFIILFLVSRIKDIKAGIVSGVFLIGYALFRILIEFVREPDLHIGLIGGTVSMGQILCLPMLFIGAMLVVFAHQGALPRYDNTDDQVE
ncbi:MAG: prolipoprotein diacylglyceryl transferase [Alphaproteobacteria bacterium]